MLEVAEEYKGKGCFDFGCFECPFCYLDCTTIFKGLKLNFEDLEFEDGVPEEIKNYVKKILK